MTTSDAGGASAATLTLEPDDAERLARLCGPYDENLRQIEQRLGITIRNRGNAFHLQGQDAVVDAAQALIAQLYRETLSVDELAADTVHLFLQESGVQALVEDARARSNAEATTGSEAANAPAEAETGLIRTRRRTIKPRGRNQQRYVRAIRDHDINFGIGPAGTGKTYLAVACAVEAFETERVARILLVRPAVEAGEKLGFLPGDLAQKIDPYLRPLYDALYEMLGFERVTKLIERNVIEVAPLAYMRGRTLNDAFIILDESQNTTVEQMKMFLTRIGYGSTAVITGDDTQIDLPRGTRSGLRHVIDVLDGIEGISFVRFGSRDVVRHPLVQAIVEAYAEHDRRAADADERSAGHGSGSPGQTSGEFRSRH